jgi:hypothetical protein
VSIDTETLLKSAIIMRDAANSSNLAADRIEQAVQRLGLMLEDGYGGNALKLIELLENAEINKGKL